jgi:quercetin dioxygenase-like cupin family protein
VEGGGEFRIKGETTMMTKPGSTWVIAPENPHTFKNGPHPTKLALAFTVEKGKPLATTVPAPT